MQAQEVLQNIERYQESVQGDDGLPLIRRIKMVDIGRNLDATAVWEAAALTAGEN